MEKHIGKICLLTTSIGLGGLYYFHSGADLIYYPTERN